MKSAFQVDRAWGMAMVCLICLLAAAMLPGVSQAAAKLSITTATYSPTTGKLTVAVATTPGQPGSLLTLLHGDGGVLAERSVYGKTQSFLFPRSQLGKVPCSVQARMDGLQSELAVKGAPTECGKPPTCQILAPAEGTALNANQDVKFQAQATLTDTGAGPLQYEWDFGGGAMGVADTSKQPVIWRQPKGLAATVQFVRGDSHYRVRFAATDTQGRRCEAAVNLTVGTPPDTGLPPVQEQPAPVRGGEIAGTANDLVVLPWEARSHQGFTDQRIQPHAAMPFGPLNTSLHSVVYKKAVKPQVVGEQAVSLLYSAASNPFDPAGAGSINSTSQNWPLNGFGTEAMPLAEASLRKTDAWEKYDPRGKTKSPVWSSVRMLTWMEYPFGYFSSPLSYYSQSPAVDEGQSLHYDLAPAGVNWQELLGSGWQAKEQAYAQQALKQATSMQGFLSDLNPDNGRRMPGFLLPYLTNDPQPFSVYSAREGRFDANWIPVTDVDDQGRVNPFPLFRVQAANSAGKVLAATDAVLSNGRDLHCRECHRKGGIGAPVSPSPYTTAAYHYPPEAAAYPTNPTDDKTKPAYFDAVNPAGRPSADLFDQEYAAVKNSISLHQYYAGANNVFDRNYRLETQVQTTLIEATTPDAAPCRECHVDLLTPEFNHLTRYTDSADNHDPSRGAFFDRPAAHHRHHGDLRYNGTKTAIQRDGRGVFKRWTWPNAQANPNTLFPVKDAKGQSLPMEENCLKCHAGEREPLYRDRHLKSNTTCYDCHGDMAALAELFKRPAGRASSSASAYRIPYYDEPDCGSCHVGTAARQGAGFFGPGVRQRAFDAKDPSATPYAVQGTDYDAVRFAVPPTYRDWPTPMISPLYREGRDAHGNVPCAACHGSAHALWPHRDPKANDNLTPLQLQGYAGPVLECRVCHTANAFAQLANLDGGTYSGLPANSGILGGPHGLHPMNDPNWWEKAAADTQPISDGSTWGGWHDNLARKPGLNGEDQCAACHGQDHKGSRLSRTPVDLEFKTRTGVASWKAGEMVGCDRCHDLASSFKGVPSGGGGVSNQAPVITSVSGMTGLNAGETYSYTVTATDADHNALTYSLAHNPAGMTINRTSGVIAWKAVAPALGDVVGFEVRASDGKGGTARQPVALVVCSGTDAHWHEAMHHCM